MSETANPRDRSGGFPVRGLIIVLLVVAVLFAGLIGWRRARTAAPPQGAPPPTVVSTIVVQPQTVPVALESVGTLQAVRQVTLAPETVGRIVAIRFEGGARVGAGAVLIQLDDAPERADRAAAQAKADFARVQLQRSQRLQPTGFEPRQTTDQRRAEYDAAVAAVRQLDARIAQKQIRAPFAGELGLRRVNPGQYVNPGDPIATLTALDRLFVNFNLPQQDLGKLRVGGSVEVAVDAYPGRIFTAVVNAIEPLVGADTRNVSVQATLPNPGGTLKPGMYVTARLMLPPQPNALLTPTTAIQTSSSGDSVMVVRNGKAQTVPVQTGRRIGDKVVVTTGLSPGDVVVTDGQLRVQPGAPVKIAAQGG
ncbi:efflux RND transporter periplasmic adaptor subunit [Phenylobacterium sp. LjRoot225]|uniref:efflux RND transporter periplasmic adaptor subunit n=1 Tax=Phenylobacterium sp. LjRoot225 TaxID=3342285 RepID=UPI003ED0DCF1